MEDQASEWENKEQGETGGSVGWIWNKGLAVGKKVLITGVVISSAPVILPPLMVISTLGLVCAVPYGLFLATYACTEKLMTTLLPSSKPQPLTFEELGAKDISDEYGGDVDMANEEEELRRRVDLRLEQDEEGVNAKDKTVGKNGYVEDIEAQEEEPPVEEVRGVMIVIEGEDENGSGVKEEVTFDVRDVAVEVWHKDDDSKANDELVKETTGLLEKIRDEGMSNEGKGEDKQSVKDGEDKDEQSVKGGMNEDKQSVKGGVVEDKQTAKGSRGGAEQVLKGTDKDVQETVTKLGNGNGRKAKKTKANKKNQKAGNADAREIADESGIDLLDNKKADSSVNATRQGSEKPSVKSIDVLEVTVPSNANAPGSEVASNE
ncbi:hypothetical protein M5689_008553 [Euphorbia peplus]|nr:hypothetical protein M5689_008553 [Euphorbia peplus]